MELERPSWAFDGYGRPVNSLNGAINIHDADVHRQPVNHFLYVEDGSYTLASAITSQDTSFTVTSAVGLVVGNRIHITDSATGAHDHDLAIITNIAGNVVTINRPFDKSYAVATTTIIQLTVEMNVVGSLASPVHYKVLPSPNEVWHINSIDFTITDNAAMDDALFGGIPALANGVVIRLVDAVNGIYETFSSWRTNASFSKDGFLTAYATKAPSGFYGYSGSMDIHARYGSVVRMANTSTENIYMEVLVQDDLSALASFEIKVHGHIENEPA